MKLSRYNFFIIIGCTAAFLILAVVAAVSLHTIRDFTDGSRWVNHTQNVLTSIEELLSLIKDAETTQRGFLISDEVQYLAPYRKAIEAIPGRLTEIRLLTRDNPKQQEAISSFEPLITERLAILEESLRFKRQGVDRIRMLETFSRGNLIMDQIRFQVARMIGEEHELLRRRSAIFEYDAMLTDQLIVLANLIAVTILAIIVWKLFREIGKRASAEQTIKRYAEEIEDLYNNTPCGYCSVDKNGVLIKVNDTWLDWFGYMREEIIGRKHLVELMTPESAQRFEQYFPVFKETGFLQNVEFEYIRKDGKVMPVSVSATAIRDAEGNYLRSRSSIFDISARKHVEQALYHSNTFLNSLVENIPNMIFVKDAKALQFVRFNKAGEELLGYSREELIGKSDSDFFPKEEADFFIAKDRAVLAKGRVVDIPEEPIHTRQQGVRILHTMKIPIADERGVPQYLLGISEDITARKEAEWEINRLNEDLVSHAAQLEATNRELESFAYSVSHDLRAPLRAIDGFARMLQQDCSDQIDDQGRRWIKVIRDNSSKMGRLIDDLLTFSRMSRTPIHAVEFDMTALVHEAMAEINGGVAPQQPEVRISPLGSARGDRALLKQVWINLLGNAVKYSSTRERPIVDVFLHEKYGDTAYAIKDNGVGFDMRFYNKLFGVFERLHSSEEFAGTGVGLAIVQRIVIRHGGQVWAESKVNEGATFYFTLRTGVSDVVCGID